MATTEERMQILKMIEEGRISAVEGADLLKALDQSKAGDAPPLKGSSQARWFRVRVTEMDTGTSKVNINIPMGLVNVGMRMGARFTPQVEGVNYKQLMEAIRTGQQGKVLDVENVESGERIEIFVE